ncbi:MAG TPA: GTPase, partial [Magnetovibrio sp.]
MSFTVAIIGRPNVGKSTLFNRLVGKRVAIVDDTPGVTRDRREGEGTIADMTFTIIDTAGLEDAHDDSLESRMRQQTERAFLEADVALMMFDARVGITPMDEHFAGWLRRNKTPVILIANKCESKASQAGLMEAYALGLGEPIAFSAEHGQGLSELYEALRPYMEASEAEEARVAFELEALNDSG